MCDHGCNRAIDCTHDRETDEWIVPSGLTSTETARPATETRQEPEPAHSPTPTRDSAVEALRLARDGGER